MAFDYGDPVPLTFETRDSSGSPADAGAVTLTITLPDLTTTSPAVANPSTGRYQVDYAPVQVGRHAVRWVATGVNASSYADIFDVRPATPSYLVSLADTKNHLNMTNTADDEELRGTIEAATAPVEDIVGPVVVRSVTEDYDTAPWLVLHQHPAISLTTLVPVLTGGTSYTVSDLDLAADTSIVRRKDGGGFAGPLRVTYRVGRPIVDAAITEAAKIIIGHMWETQRGHNGPRPGFGEEALVPTPSGFLIPRRAEQMLHPFRRGPVAA